MLKRAAIAVHRWLGVALCLLFFLWFASGIGMMYWDFPTVTDVDRAARAAPLAAAQIAVSPDEAYARLGRAQPPAATRLSMFDGRPAYRFRAGRADLVVFADTGEPRREISREALDRIAASWTGRPAAAAAIASVDAVDQWTVQGALRTLRPLWKYSWPDGEQVYVAQASGDVVQYTTRASRLGAYVGAIPHWLYFTPLRSRQLAWTRVVIWTSGIGTIAALLGLVVGVWMYSPSKRYRYNGAPAHFPYRGQKRWHAIAGLAFGVGAATWAFSGMLSMDPFPSVAGGGARSGRGDVASAIRAPADLSAYRAKDPRRALEQLAGARVNELELVSLAGQPVYVATLGDRTTRVVPLDGDPREAVDADRLKAAVSSAIGPTGGAAFTQADRYDRYYLDRRGRKPLPVIVASLNDPDGTRYYIDLKTARIVGAYTSGSWVNRWLYHGLHSLDFPWLYNYRPAWDIVVIALLAGGAALSVTSIVLAWRVIRGTQG